MIRVNLQETFNRIPLDDDCNNCDYLRETKDMFETGDSPSDFMCAGTCFDCPRVAKQVEEIEEWLSEHPDYVELLEQTL